MSSGVAADCLKPCTALTRTPYVRMAAEGKPLGRSVTVEFRYPDKSRTN